MKIPKINLKKIDKLTEDPDIVRKIVWGWAKKSLKDQNLPWETAMKSAAEELGLNKAELVALIYGNEQFSDLAYGLSIYKNLRSLEFEREKFLGKLFKTKKIKVDAC